MDKLTDDIVDILAKMFYDRLRKQGEKDGTKWFTWEQHLDSWKEYYKDQILYKIKDLEFSVVNEWIDRGQNPYAIALFIKLLYDVDEYSRLQKERLALITDPIMKQGIIDSLRNKYD